MSLYKTCITIQITQRLAGDAVVLDALQSESDRFESELSTGQLKAHPQRHQQIGLQ